MCSKKDNKIWQTFLVSFFVIMKCDFCINREFQTYTYNVYIIKTKKPFHKSEKAKNAGQKNKTKHTDFAYNSLDKGA